MINDTGTHHIQIDVGAAAKKMVSVFNSRCMVAVLPVCPIASLPLIKLLAGPTGNQLHGFWNHITVAIVGHEQMNVVRGDDVIQNRQTVSFSRPI
jgi:hypothetical protein